MEKSTRQGLRSRARRTPGTSAGRLLVAIRVGSATFVLLCLLTVWGAACQTPRGGKAPGSPMTGGAAGRPQGSPVDPTGDPYFDEDLCAVHGLLCVPDRPRRNAFRWAFVDVQLAELGEPSLRPVARRAGEAYRVVIATSFHGTAILRLELLPQGGGTLLLWNPDGYCSNVPVRRTEPRRTVLAQPEVDGLLTVLGEVGFWTLDPGDGFGGLDGTDWYLEGSRAGEHRIVHRHTPGDPIRQIAEAFTEAAGCQHRPLD